MPRKSAMTVDTIFDLASLTKVIATTTAVMQLVERGKIRLEDPVSEYWPEFKANGKEEITIRELMTHYSGLRGDLPLEPEWSGYETALQLIIGEKPIAPPPGTALSAATEPSPQAENLAGQILTRLRNASRPALLLFTSSAGSAAMLRNSAAR